MPKYKVTLNITRKAEIGLFAKDEQAAMEKAEALAQSWDRVVDVEVISAEREEV